MPAWVSVCFLGIKLLSFVEMHDSQSMVVCKIISSKKQPVGVCECNKMLSMLSSFCTFLLSPVRKPYIENGEVYGDECWGHCKMNIKKVSAIKWVASTHNFGWHTRSHVKQGNPLNLSILLSGGKETNQHSLSKGDWRGKSSPCESVHYAPNCSLLTLPPFVRAKSLGTGQLRGWDSRSHGLLRWVSLSRVVWDCSSKPVVNSI